MNKKQITLIFVLIVIASVLNISSNETRISTTIDEHNSVFSENREVNKQQFLTVSKSTNYGISISLPLSFSMNKNIKKYDQKLWEHQFDIGEDSIIQRSVQITSFQNRQFEAFWFGKGTSEFTAHISDRLIVEGININETDYGMTVSFDMRGPNKNYSNYVKNELDKIVQERLLTSNDQF